MLTRRRIAISTIIFVVIFASLLNGGTKRRIEVFSFGQPETTAMALVYSWPGPAYAPVKCPAPAVYFPEIFSEKKTYSASLADLLGMRRTAESLAAQIMLAAALRLDDFFGSEKISTQLVHLALRLPIRMLIMAPTMNDPVGESPAKFFSRNSLFPRNFFSALYLKPGEGKCRELESLSVELFADFILREKEPADVVPARIRLESMDTSEYPNLSPLLEGEVHIAFDPNLMVFSYSGRNGPAVSYCARTAQSENKCSRRTEPFSSAEQKKMSAWAKALPVVPENHGREKAGPLLARCAEGKSNPEEARQLQKLVLEYSALAKNEDTTNTYLLRLCGEKTSNHKLVDYAQFLDRKEQINRLRFLRPEIFFTKLIGKNPAPPLPDINWYSDFYFFFGKDFPSWTSAASAHTAGLDSSRAPSSRAMDLLLASMAVRERHAGRILETEFQRTILSSAKSLSSAEIAWIQESLQTL